MAKPRPDLPDRAALLALLDGEGRLALRVTPGARVEALAVEDGRVLAKVRAKPQNGAANEAVIALLAEALGCASSRIALLRGATSREKLVRVSLG
jgi:uncharacterized protein YggU (UPF0235/DUF167 family)